MVQGNTTQKHLMDPSLLGCGTEVTPAQQYVARNCALRSRLAARVHIESVQRQQACESIRNTTLWKRSGGTQRLPQHRSPQSPDLITCSSGGNVLMSSSLSFLQSTLSRVGQNKLIQMQIQSNKDPWEQQQQQRSSLLRRPCEETNSYSNRSSNHHKRRPHYARVSVITIITVILLFWHPGAICAFTNEGDQRAYANFVLHMSAGGETGMYFNYCSDQNTVNDPCSCNINGRQIVCNEEGRIQEIHLPENSLYGNLSPDILNMFTQLHALNLSSLTTNSAHRNLLKVSSAEVNCTNLSKCLDGSWTCDFSGSDLRMCSTKSSSSNLPQNKTKASFECAYDGYLITESTNGGEMPLNIKDVASAQHCWNLCTKYSFCLFFSFSPYGNTAGTCLLHSRLGDIQSNSKWLSGSKTCDDIFFSRSTSSIPASKSADQAISAATPTRRAVQALDDCYTEGYRYVRTGSQPIATETTDPDVASCQNVCLTNSDCLYFAIKVSGNSNAGQCELFSDISAGVTEASNWDLGPRSCSSSTPTSTPTDVPTTAASPTKEPTTSPTKSCFTEGFRFERTDAQPFLTETTDPDADSCQALCETNDSCLYFAVKVSGNSNEGQCELYSDISAGTVEASNWVLGPRTCAGTTASPTVSPTPYPSIATSAPTTGTVAPTSDSASSPTIAPTSSPTECITEGFRFERTDAQPFLTETTDPDADSCQALCETNDSCLYFAVKVSGNSNEGQCELYSDISAGTVEASNWVLGPRTCAGTTASPTVSPTPYPSIATSAPTTSTVAPTSDSASSPTIAPTSSPTECITEGFRFERTDTQPIDTETTDPDADSCQALCETNDSCLYFAVKVSGNSNEGQCELYSDISAGTVEASNWVLGVRECASTTIPSSIPTQAPTLSPTAGENTTRSPSVTMSPTTPSPTALPTECYTDGYRFERTDTQPIDTETTSPDAESCQALCQSNANCLYFAVKVSGNSNEGQCELYSDISAGTVEASNWVLGVRECASTTIPSSIPTQAPTLSPTAGEDTTRSPSVTMSPTTPSPTASPTECYTDGYRFERTDTQPIDTETTSPDAESCQALCQSNANCLYFAVKVSGNSNEGQCELYSDISAGTVEASNWVLGVRECASTAIPSSIPTQAPTLSPTAGEDTTRSPSVTMSPTTPSPTASPTECYTDGYRFERTDTQPIDTETTSPDAESCQALCQSNTNCLYFAVKVSGNSNDGQCELYSDISSGLTSASNWVYGPRTCGTSAPTSGSPSSTPTQTPTSGPTRAPSAAPTLCIIEGYRLERTDTQPFTTTTTDPTASACQSECVSVDGCIYFAVKVSGDSNTGQCELYSDISAGIVEAPNWVYGLGECGGPTATPTSSPTTCFFTDMTYTGEVIEELTSIASSTECQDECVTVDECYYFTFKYQGDNNGTCILLSAVNVTLTGEDNYESGPKVCGMSLAPTLAPTNRPVTSTAPTPTQTPTVSTTNPTSSPTSAPVTLSSDQSEAWTNMYDDLSGSNWVACTSDENPCNDPSCSTSSGNIQRYVSCSVQEDQRRLIRRSRRFLQSSSSPSSITAIVLPLNGMEGLLTKDTLDAWTSLEVLNLTGNDITGDGPNDCIDAQLCYESGVVCDVPSLCGEMYSVNSDGSSEWTPVNSTSDSYSTLDVSTGESVLFEFSNSSNVVRLASLDAYESCNFTDSTLLAGSSEGSYRFVADQEDEGKTVYITSSLPVGSHANCKNGQRIAIRVASVSTSAPTTSGGDTSDDSSKANGSGINWIWLIIIILLVVLCGLPCVILSTILCMGRFCPDSLPGCIQAPLDRCLLGSRSNSLGRKNFDSMLPYTNSEASTASPSGAGGSISLSPISTGSHQRAQQIKGSEDDRLDNGSAFSPLPPPGQGEGRARKERYNSGTTEVFLSPISSSSETRTSSTGHRSDEDDLMGLHQNKSLQKVKLEAMAIGNVVSQPITCTEDLLREAGLEEHIEEFQNEDMDLEATTYATEGQLRDLGLSVGEAARLRHITRTLQRKLAMPDRSSTGSSSARLSNKSNTQSQLRGVLKKPHPEAYSVLDRQTQFNVGDRVAVERTGTRTVVGKVIEVKDTGHATREPRYVVEIQQGSGSRTQIVREPELRRR